MRGPGEDAVDGADEDGPGLVVEADHDGGVGEGLQVATLLRPAPVEIAKSVNVYSRPTLPGALPTNFTLSRS